ncbi:hypothetical protein AVEN_76075-1 [Araneus ventricosus]|uniref:Uncharacterized protein n=1 Tax=Araneus ventricosus TaxID=182803 RepID=A0A4Y2NHG0_ARAVE|nr:hypothetical protein AVEN_76075-1 [Araneus ventricosus]
MLVSPVTRLKTTLPNKLLKKELTSIFRPPKCHLKKVLRNLSHNKDFDSVDSGRSFYNVLPKVSLTQASCSIYVAMLHYPFPSYLYRFRLHHSDICACGKKGDPLHYETSCPLTSFFRFT